MLLLPFEIKRCPQDCGKECGASLDKCPTYPKLPPEFQEVCKANLHLLQYVHMLPSDKIKTPAFAGVLHFGSVVQERPQLP